MEPSARRPYVPLVVRFMKWTRLPPVLAATLLFVLVQVIFFVWMNAIGYIDGGRHRGAIVLRYRLYWFEVLSALLFAGVAYRIAAAPRAAARRLAELAPVLGDASVDLAYPSRLLRGAAAASVAVSVAFTLWVADAMGAAGDVWPRGVLAWIMLRNALVFGAIGVCLGYDLHVAGAFDRAGRALRSVDLLDPAPLQPFGRQALQGALLWLGLASLVAFFLFDDLSRRWTVSFLVFLGSLSATLLVLPARGVRARVRAEKRKEAERVRVALRSARERALAPAGLSPGAEIDDAALRLGALASYLQLVESAREWPFDAPTLVRIGLTLALPLGSWLGGALVERIVGWALG